MTRVPRIIPCPKVHHDSAPGSPSLIAVACKLSSSQREARCTKLSRTTLGPRFSPTLSAAGYGKAPAPRARRQRRARAWAAACATPRAESAAARGTRAASSTYSGSRGAGVWGGAVPTRRNAWHARAAVRLRGWGGWAAGRLGGSRAGECARLRQRQLSAMSSATAPSVAPTASSASARRAAPSPPA